MSVTLANMGATGVYAVDKAPASIKHDGVLFVQSYFDRWKMPDDVQIAVVSWPQNNRLPGIADLLKRIPDVIYLGKNTDGTSCGTGTLFAGLILRDTARYLPDRHNVLIHYGSRPRDVRTLHHEEFAAIVQTKLYRYDPSPDQRDILGWEAT